jgi:hypothetical protein
MLSLFYLRLLSLLVSFLAYTGATSRDILAVLNNEKQMDTGQIILLVTGAVAFVLVLVVIGYHVQRQMKGIEGRMGDRGVDDSGSAADVMCAGGDCREVALSNPMSNREEQVDI